MKNAIEERVLCFKKELLPKYLNQEVFFDPFLWNRILDNITPLPRSKAEHDYNYKQLSTYILLKFADTYLSYKRTKIGNESRLWGKYSIGIGGHINIDDKAQQTLLNAKKNSMMDFFIQTVWRELDEEIEINHNVLSKPEFLRFINDNFDDVGKMHFGLVWLFRLKRRDEIKAKKELAELKFLDIQSLKVKKERYERWSQLLIDQLLGEIL